MIRLGIEPEMQKDVVCFSTPTQPRMFIDDEVITVQAQLEKAQTKRRRHCR